MESLLRQSPSANWLRSRAAVMDLFWTAVLIKPIAERRQACRPSKCPSGACGCDIFFVVFLTVLSVCLKHINCALYTLRFSVWFEALSNYFNCFVDLFIVYCYIFPTTRQKNTYSMLVKTRNFAKTKAHFKGSSAPTVIGDYALFF